MGKRKLASVQYVHHITPIEGADRIECVHVLGWQCVANKGQFQVGDHCVYFEVDSFLPVCDRFEFLRSSSYKKSEILGEGFRLKTLKFRGQISQGLVQPLSILPEGEYELGTDVTELLGVRKWEIECKCQYKNVGFISYKHVGKTTCLYEIFSYLPAYIASGPSSDMKDHLY